MSPDPISAATTEFQMEHDGSLSLSSAVFQALGAASTCWERLNGAGVFQSDRAKEIGDALVELLGGDRQLIPPEPRCICGPLADSNGEDIDERPDCPRHGTTPAAVAYQESRQQPWTGEDPY